MWFEPEECNDARQPRKERRGEEPHFKRWFEQHGLSVHELPRDLPFEGAGDALLDRKRGALWAGYGLRTELDAHPRLAERLGVEVHSLRLIDPRFYHLDTCFCPLENGCVIYYPPAFDAHSNRLIESVVPAAQRIPIDEIDAVNFACNAVNIDNTIVLNKAGDALKSRLLAEGFEVIETPLGEFMKSGGAAKCLTLRIEPPLPAAAPRAEPLRLPYASRVLHIEGHLLDSGLLERALEITVEGGGSFQILNFKLGR